MTPEEIKAISLREFEEVWGKGNVAVVDELYAPDYVYHNPSFPQVTNREAIKQMTAELHTVFPDLRWTWEEAIVEGDKIVQRWTVRGTQTAPWTSLGIPATGKKVEMEGIRITRIVDRKIVDDWSLNDALTMMQQLGVIPAPA